MKRCLFLLLFVFHALVAEEEQDFSLVNLTKSPIPRVAGTVNIVTGNWVDQSSHQETTGPDPYVVAHSYISSSLEEGSLADGWDLYHPSELLVFQPQGIQYVRKSPSSHDVDGLEKNDLSPFFKGHIVSVPAPFPITKGFRGRPPKPQKPHRPPRDSKADGYPMVYPTMENPAELVYREAGGATYVFTGDHYAEHFHPKIHTSGYNHISSIDSPTRRDIRRTKVKWDRSHDEWDVLLGDGTKRIYSRTNAFKHCPPFRERNFVKATYCVREEILPSGNRRWYLYNSDKELKTIQTVSSDGKYVLHFVEFHRDHGSVEAKTSEGLSTHFSLKKLRDRENAHVVDSIKRPARGNLSFSYCDKSSCHTRRIYEKSFGNGRKDTVKFYHEGKNEVGTEVIRVSSKKEKKFLQNRVREIWTRQYVGHKPVLSHAFTYKEWQTHGEANVKESDGASTAYIWDTERRPTWIGRETRKGKRLSSEHFIWGKGRDEGRLIRRTYLDNSARPLLDHEFEFDTDGNVTEETLRGLFTGHHTKKMSIDGHKHVHGGEVFTWKAKYTDDGRCLKKAEVDPLGNWTYFEYDDKRCLLTARFTCDGEKIIKREFFAYDSAAICTKTIVDDGSSRHEDHLSGVTRRVIHRVKPRRVTPYFGAPDEESWSAWTSTFGEQVLKVERYTRDQFGRAVAKELVDAFDVVQKRWTYAYDSCHRLVESCDPTGRIEHFEYDDAGRVVIKATPEATCSFTYDLLDRVIEEKKAFPDGSTESLCFQYDLSGREVTKIDSRGRATTKYRDLCGRVVKTKLPEIATENGVVRPNTFICYSGAHEWHVSPTKATTEIIRSAAGKALVPSNPFGAKTYCYYDGRNRLVEQKDSTGLATINEYDALDRPTRIEQRVNGEAISVVTKMYRGFDLVEERYPTKVVNYTYDTIGRKVREEVTDLLTHQTASTRTHYDSLHRPVHIFHDAVGTEEYVTYDAADREIERKVIGSDGSLLSVTTKAYDLAGRVIEEGVGRSGTIASTKTTYGAYGLPASISYPDGTAARFAYNPLYRWSDGHLYLQKVITDARGVVTEQLLDSNDEARLTTVRDPFGAVISQRTVIFSILGKPVLIEDHEIASGQDKSVVRTRLEYDVVGQMTSCTLGEGTPDAATWHYRYDAEGRKIEESKPSGIALASSYDEKGRLASLRSSDNSIAWNYHYNVQDLPEQIENEATGKSTFRRYNGLGAMVEETLENGLSLSYDIAVSGLLSSITYPDGSCSSYQYAFGRLSGIERNGYSYHVDVRDLSGLITSATLPKSAGQIAQAVDVMGRKTLMYHEAFCEERTVFDPVGCCLERVVDGNHEMFTYDYLCQLTSDNGRSASYDSLHRRFETEGIGATHNARHQMLSHGKTTFQYDVDGRRTQDNRFRYGYDACDRLVSVEDDTTRYEYAYDPFNRRLSSTKIVQGREGPRAESQERFLWQGDCEVGSVDEHSKLLSLRVLGEGLGGEIGAAVFFEREGEAFVPLHDLSGHVRACLNTAGDVVERLDYTAFGLKSRTADVTPWTFSSKRQDEGTGFLYFGRRYYDAETATWLTQDPLGYSAGPNLYAYVKNNPLTCIDLYGLEERLLKDEPNYNGRWSNDFALSHDSDYQGSSFTSEKCRTRLLYCPRSGKIYIGRWNSSREG